VTNVPSARLAFHELGEQLKRQHAAEQEAAAQRRRGKGNAATLPDGLADALKPGRKGEPARGDLFAEAFIHPENPSPSDRVMPAFGEVKPEAMIAAAFSPPESPASAPQQPQEAASGHADDAPPPEPAPAPQKAAEAPPLPATSSALFEEIGKRIEEVTAPPPLSTAGELRQALRAASGDAVDAITRKIERETYQLEGYLNQHEPAYRTALVVSALEHRLSDARRLQPDYTVADLLEAMRQA